MSAQHAPFIIFSLPRSRSAWLSVFLSYQGRTIGHDIGPDSTTPEDFLSRIGDGTCETGAAFAWRLIREERPEVRFVVVQRDPEDVVQSLERFGLLGYRPEIAARAAHLQEIAALPDTFSLPYTALANRSACAALFAFCHGRPMPDWWFDRFDPLNIQVDMAKQVAKLRANYPRIEALKAEVARRLAHA